MKWKLKRFLRWLRWGKIKSVDKDWIDNIICETAYYDRWGRLIGYWAYGNYDPELPYQGD